MYNGSTFKNIVLMVSCEESKMRANMYSLDVVLALYPQLLTPLCTIPLLFNE